MPKEQKVLGIDGCRGGWCCAIYRDNKMEVAFYPDLSQLFKVNGDFSLAFIDIPIGLADAGTSRHVEKQMRQMLKPFRHSSVFTPPCREAIVADDYHSAKMIQKTITGKMLSIQAFYIMKKIKEMDDFIRKNLHLTPKIFESHPEICFYSLNGNEAMRHNKKKRDGVAERIKVLEKYFADANDILVGSIPLLQEKNVARDDVIDALCLALSGHLANVNIVHFVKNTPVDDAFGLPIQIAYGQKSHV